jgi:hypothetical protein
MANLHLHCSRLVHLIYGPPRKSCHLIAPLVWRGTPAIRSSARPIPQVRPTGGGSSPLSGQSFAPGVLGTEPLVQ